MPPFTSLFFLLLWLVFPVNVSAGLLIRQSDAIQQIFPQAKCIQKNLFLSDSQITQLEKISKAKFESKLISYFECVSEKKWVGTVFIDQHRVRTMPETVLIALDPQGKLLKIKILAFNEPLDYLPSARWLGFFEGKELNDRLWLKQDFDAISGATLSSWAILRAVRRSLALYTLIKG